jgi:hypothetical protein
VQSTKLNGGYVANDPVPAEIPDTVELMAKACIDLKKIVLESDITESCFGSRSLSTGRSILHSCTSLDVNDALAASLHSLEAISESEVFATYNVLGDDLSAVLDETGSPAGWYPLIAGYDIIPSLPDGLSLVLLGCLTDHPRHNLPPPELADIKRWLKALYAAGFKGSVEDDEPEPGEDEDDEAEEAADIGARIPIPAETFVEELSGKLEVHPISIYWLLKEGREKEGWRCPPEEKRLMEDRLTVLILRLLGHRLPRQVEAGEPIPNWADRDGIIPLTPGCGEPTLADRVEERLSAGFPDSTLAAVKREFAEVVGQGLDDWLAGAFFARHISQFRKRPIAWQIQSRPETAAGGADGARPRPGRRSPAWSTTTSSTPTCSPSSEPITSVRCARDLRPICGLWRRSQVRPMCNQPGGSS